MAKARKHAHKMGTSLLVLTAPELWQTHKECISAYTLVIKVSM